VVSVSVGCGVMLFLVLVVVGSIFVVLVGSGFVVFVF